MLTAGRVPFATLIAKDVGFGSRNDTGSIYDTQGKKTTWTNQDLVDSGDDSHTYPINTDTYVGYDPNTKALTYDEVPAFDPPPTPSGDFIYFVLVRTDGTQVDFVEVQLPTSPVFSIGPRFVTQDDTLILGDTDVNGSSGVPFGLTVIGHSNATRKIVLAQNSGTGIRESYSIQTGSNNQLAIIGNRGAATARPIVSYLHSDISITLVAPSGTDDWIQRIAHDEANNSVQVRGRFTVSGGGGTTALVSVAVPAGRVASARVFYQEQVATVGRVVTTSAFVFDGGAPPTVTQLTGGGTSITGGLGANDLGFIAIGGDIRLVVNNTGANARRYDFVVDFLTSLAP